VSASSVKFYTATKSRNQGREAWSVIFRHPARLDVGTGKTGRRVRRGLGTSDDSEAERLVEQLNEILRNPELWEPSARSSLNGRYDARVVEIFYDGLEATQLDFEEVREERIPLPTRDDGYRTVLLLGTTGAGKTTLVRQMLGTDPKTERFPSTSTAKTTVADTELITTEDDVFRAVVTFAPRDEIIDYLAENVSRAALSARQGKLDAKIALDLLDHQDQRFRFSYVLGRGSAAAVGGDEDLVDDDDLPDDEFDDHSEVIDGDLDPEEYGHVDIGATERVLQQCVVAVKGMVARYAEEIAAGVVVGQEDERILDELIEDALDTDLRQSEEFHQIVDALIDEVEKRFATLEVGEFRRNRQGWPVSWWWESHDRATFMKVVTRFSSNYAPLFGRLLTPLVNGLRVSGPFQPKWADGSVRLVFVDGEGLGHTAKSVSSLSTHVQEQLQRLDAVMLVDNATQPMQAAPVAALKQLVVSGIVSKLHVVFTHFDQVKGDNLPTFSLREEHVLASVDNVLKAIGEELTPAAERVLHRRIEKSRFFVGGIHERLDPSKRKLDARTVRQMQELLDLLAHPERAADTGDSRPVFDRMNLSLAVTEAAKTFHHRWLGVLGLQPNPDAPKEHWTRIKAMSRRLAEGWYQEGYDNLMPVADLSFQLQIQIYLMLQRPVRWTGGEAPSEAEQEATLDALANAVAQKLIEVSRRQIKEDAQLTWQRAYAQRGVGSTFDRARIISHDIYDRGAPIPTAVASPDQNKFLRSVAEAIDEVANEFGAELE
jgi:energy-coupling factor transporter ATP-binding protein EcfA2